MKVLFFHSGPGLNSNPEKHLLTDQFSLSGFELHCWNEPSNLRHDDFVSNDGGYQDYLNSAEAFLLEHYKDVPIIIIAHSFSANAALFLAEKHPGKIKHIFFVAPSLSRHHTDINTLRLIVEDYRNLHDDRLADELTAILNKYTGQFDENTLNGFMIAGQNPRLFDYFWHNEQIKQTYLSWFTPPAYVLDFETYVTVRKTWYPADTHRSMILATGVFGKFDRVISNDVEQEMLKQRFDNLDIVEFSSSAHYPHMEETALFLKLLGKFI